ncbi:MAG: carboxypeptidase regulatory-like domain-containing protein [Deltaproteobacteria bacterium]|nr:carboxypeptidase regulatory-like domain-containing protein [Deltaproteobacteria bacterium]
MPKRSLAERCAIWLAALTCLVAVAGLVDWPVGRTVTMSEAAAPVAKVALVVRALAGDAPANEARARLFVETRGRVALVAEARGGGGELRLEGVPTGPAWLVVDGPGLARVARRIAVLPEEEEHEVTLAPAEAFEVVVVDGAQRPIRNAAVLVHGDDPLPDALYTDPSGLAAFDALGAGPYAIEIVAPGFGRKLLRDQLTTASPLFVRLEPDAELVVHVVDPDGAKAAGATVLVAGSTLWPARSAVADEGGRVAFTGLPRGFYELRATRDGAVSEPNEGVLLEPGEPRELELRLVRGVFVEVLVSDGDGEPPRPVVGADVAVVEGGLSSFPIYGQTGADGIARVGPIVGGDGTVSAQAPGFVPRSAVPVEQGQGQVRVALHRAGALVGRVVDERGYPIEGASLEAVGVGIDGMPIADSTMMIGLRRDHVALAAPGPTPLVPRGALGVMPVVPGVPPTSAGAAGARPTAGLAPWSSRRDGTFEVEPVSPGRVQLLARHPRFVDALTPPIALGPGERGELVVTMRRGGALEGRVLEGGRHPVAAARIELLSPDGAIERITFSADDGTFAFSGVPGEVVVAVARPEEPETILEKLAIDVPADGRRAVEIALPERREPVLFRITDDRGFPVERAEIAAASLDPGVALVRTSFSDDAGSSWLSGARGLPLRVAVRRRGHAPRVVEIPRAPAELTVALVPEITLEGEVRSRDGWLAGASVTLLTPTGDRHARTDAGGRFRIGELAPGPARLLVTAKGHAFDERDIALEPDTRGLVVLPTLELERGAALEGLVVDERGRPLAGARVAVGRVPTFLPTGPLPPGVTQTDAEGRFSLVDLEPGKLDVEAFKLGLGRAGIEDVELRAGEVRRELRIELVADPEALPPSPAPASLAVTLSELEAERGPAFVLDHVPYGGEAQRAGLLAGDELLRIDGHELASLEEARRRLDGPLSHDMVLELYRSKLGRYRVRVRREVLRP